MAHLLLFLFPFALANIAVMIIYSPTAAAPIYLDSICSNETTIYPNSSYEINLKALFVSLVSSAATTNFYSTVAGSLTRYSVYGLFLCRGDLNSTACKDCVEAATLELHQSYCPLRKVAIIWYNECFVRYSNKSLFGKLEESPRLVVLSNENITAGNQEIFTEFSRQMMNDLAVQAASSESGKKFAMRKVNLTGPGALYMFVQCTPDLTASNCTSCLMNAITLLRARISGRVLNPSCEVWYETSWSYFESLPPELITSTDTSATTGTEKLLVKVIVLISLPIASISLALVALCVITRKANKYNIVDETDQEWMTIESLRLDLASLQNATNYFSDDCKVAECVYGCIYKGKLSSGREVLIKKPFRNHRQNEEEFKGEILSHAKLQHRNLVEFVGFCLDGEAKLVVHEFVSNLSLHYFLKEPERRRELDWATRYHIIQGIARGMLYLDQDSWLRIVHCDIRPGNILLDADMNAKISHFGLSVASQENEMERSTETYLGSFGYKSSTDKSIKREFSVKSNVFCFGVLLLAIIGSERYSRLTDIFQLNFSEHLLNQAWKEWREGTPLDFVDPTLTNPCSSDEVLRCMHIGLLCIQRSLNDRPTMASVVFMLNSSTVTLQPPEEPAFFFLSETKPKTSMCQQAADAVSCSINSATISEIQPR